MGCMAIHPTILQLDGYALGLLGEAEATRVRDHLFECVACLERFVAITDKAAKTAGANQIRLVSVRR